jgi:hypothetical protein
MTRKKAAPELEKPHRLTLAELAAHDDVCSDAMIDNVCLDNGNLYDLAR